MIEHLPAELRDRFTEMREMDLSVQSEYNPVDLFRPFHMGAIDFPVRCLKR